MRIVNKSIRSVLKDIESGNMILPALQREFVWKRRDIENLFDSLLQGFPINTLMLWKVDDIKKEPMQFYKFLAPEYKEAETVNEIYPVRDNDRKTVVIDGQQRLTSLWIAIYGSYTLEKGKNKMYLYLNLDGSQKGDSEDGALENADSFYNFKFLAEEKAKRLIDEGEHWIKVSDAYAADFKPLKYLNALGLATDFAQDTLQKLYDLFRSESVLNAYEIEDQNLQRVLNIFVRTNSGGKPLSKGDLLLSMITVNWAGTNADNAREFVQGVVGKVANYGYRVDKDWVLSCILYIMNKDVKLNVESFDIATSKAIYGNKDKITGSIEAACRVLNFFGMLERGITTKLALLPIVHHIYNHDLAGKVKSYHRGQKAPVESGIYLDMRTWLFRAIVTNLFEAGTRDTLNKIQAIQNASGKPDYFPVAEIIAALDKLKVDDTLIERLMQTEKRQAFPVLNIIYSSTSGRSYLTQTDYDVDHVHAQSLFDKNSNDKRYDTIPNLQLLTHEENISKNDMTLKEWWDAKPDGEKKEYLLPSRLESALSAFDDFFKKRKEWLQAILAEKLDASDSTYAGISHEEKVLAAAFREGREKYPISWNMHGDRAMLLTLGDGQTVKIEPKHILEFTGISEQQKQALETKSLAKEWFHETTDKWNNTLSRESEYGIDVSDCDDVEEGKHKVLEACDCLLSM